MFGGQSFARDFLIEQDVVTRRVSVLGAGSICGVNTERFSNNESVREIVRHELGTALIQLFVCNWELNRDKGMSISPMHFLKLLKAPKLNFGWLG